MYQPKRVPSPARQEELREEIWQNLLEALDKCQSVINMIDELDAGSNSLVGEWEEIDSAYGHMHNVKRWIGRAWRSQEARRAASGQATDTMVMTSQQARKILDDLEKLRGPGQ